MAITGGTPEQYQELLKNGGELSLEIDAEDISLDEAFEQNPLIKPNLYTGFELPPSSIIDTPEFLSNLTQYGDNWTSIIASVYLRGGRIFYKKLERGKYEAKITIPPQDS